MKILVCGGRKYDAPDTVFGALDRLRAAGCVDMVIHGGAKGADALAGRWAHDRGVQEVICPANWDRRGTWAGPIRNSAMLLLQPDLVLAFPGGKGTEDMVRKAEAKGIRVQRISVSESGDAG